ncbi:hypothetical protein BDV95DRAFT_157659 [Massariosphaeria phaeospora]|uniref:Uncharacterized protein n=1 Tax=Massariosphaeria phaeospora TaxID=100035 RepID=A0A7C8M5K6_9PLEO|nr:hypothetical protein BDV95DRAFT_157659 [Massariosphaeria phaeospora]
MVLGFLLLLRAWLWAVGRKFRRFYSCGECIVTTGGYVDAAFADVKARGTRDQLNSCLLALVSCVGIMYSVSGCAVKVHE